MTQSGIFLNYVILICRKKSFVLFVFRNNPFDILKVKYNILAKLGNFPTQRYYSSTKKNGINVKYLRCVVFTQPCSLESICSCSCNYHTQNYIQKHFWNDMKQIIFRSFCPLPKDKLVGRSSDKSHWPICHVKVFLFSFSKHLLLC